MAELIGQIEVSAIATEKMFGESISKFFSIAISILLISGISAMVWVGPRVTSSMAISTDYGTTSRPQITKFPNEHCGYNLPSALYLLLLVALNKL